MNGIGAPLEFEWDPTAGAVRGADAAHVRALAEEALRSGVAMGHPYPTPYPVSDPLRNAGELAVLLGMVWRLPDELERAYPAPPAMDELPPGTLA